jgi:hypothetical protein
MVEIQTADHFKYVNEDGTLNGGDMLPGLKWQYTTSSVDRAPEEPIKSRDTMMRLIPHGGMV